MAFVMINIGCRKLFVASPGHSALIAGHRAIAHHQKSAIPFQWIRLCPLESPREIGRLGAASLGRHDHLAGDLPIGVPDSITRSISAAPRSTMGTAQTQDNSTMTPPSAPSEL